MCRLICIEICCYCAKDVGFIHICDIFVFELLGMMEKQIKKGNADAFAVCLHTAKGVNLGLVGAFAVYSHTAKDRNLGPNDIFAVCLIHGKEPLPC